MIRQSDVAEYNITYMKYATLDQAAQALLLYSTLSRTGTYSLSTMHQLMSAVGNPHERIRVIHVAGTSGKTSTCYYIRALLELSGCRTGMTVSPHITAINERVQIAGVPLDESRFLEYLDTFLDMVDRVDLAPSYYELTMAFAYYVFGREQVEYAVIETGVGGLLDGSNIASHQDKICVIQRIGYDHTEILGDTVEKIALQKAGIIHEHNIVFVLEQPEAALDTIVSYAGTKHAEVTIVKDTHDADVKVAFQQANWSLALAVYTYIVDRDRLHMIDAQQMRIAKGQTAPGRYEVRVYKGKKVILDGAHNEQKFTALLDSLPTNDVQKPIVIFSIKQSKGHKAGEYLKLLKGHCSQLVLTTFAVGQDMRSIKNVNVAIVKRYADEIGIRATVVANEREALAYALGQEPDTIVITGSLYLISEMRKLIVD